MEQTRTHVFPMDRQTALCGRSLPRSDHGYDVMLDDTGNEEHLCAICRVIMGKKEGAPRGAPS